MDLTKQFEWKGGENLTYYIAGPMTGYPNFNRATFEDVTQLMRDLGYNVLSPHEVPHNTDTTPWHECLRHDIQLLLRCQVVVLLPGWQRSKGATLEALIGAALGMTILEYRYPRLDPYSLDMLDMAWLFIRARLLVSA